MARATSKYYYATKIVHVDGKILQKNFRRKKTEEDRLEEMLDDMDDRRSEWESNPFEEV